MQKLTPRMKREEIPLPVLLDRKLSCFESIIEYLKDERKLTYHQIAMLTKRDDRTIWTIYNRARIKRKHEKTSYEFNKRIVKVPIRIFQDRDVSVLETISLYLKDEKKLKYSKIAKLTNREDTTIWTAYNRAKTKRKLLK